MSLYSRRGVSAQKEDVHQAIKNLDQGLYPNAFCKIYADSLCGDAEWVNVMHADGAGTKSVLAYLYWKETGDVNVWKGIAQDAVVMNLDDLICTGICNNILFSSTIDRNKKRIPGEVLEAIITGTRELFEELNTFGVSIHYLGGETADVGDVVRTIAVNGTMSVRWPAKQLITNDRIGPGDVIVAFSSAGQTTYESAYNSGIGSNGLTSARHDVLHTSYGSRFPESYESTLDSDVVYIGNHHLADPINVSHYGKHYPDLTIGDLLLSPTRTYAPLMKLLLSEHFTDLHGVIHCSGGGQTKCLKYLPGPMRIIKDQLFEPPAIFQLIQNASGADLREMYQVFNMGHRLEIFTTDKAAEKLISCATSLHLEAQVIGRVEESDSKELVLVAKGDTLIYR